MLRNSLKTIVLQCVGSMKGVSSTEVSGRLGYFGVSERKKVSMTLLKCARQRLLFRFLRKHGRVREYSYVLTERGRRRLEYYMLKEEKVESGVINVDGIVKAAGERFDPLWTSALVSFFSAEYICRNTRQQDVFSEALWCVYASTNFIFRREELVLAYASMGLLKAVSPDALAVVKEAVKEMLRQDVVATKQKFTVYSRIIGLFSRNPPEPSVVDNPVFRRLMIDKLNRLDFGQRQLCGMLKREENEKEMYKGLYESAMKTLHLENEYLESRFKVPNVNACRYVLQNVTKVFQSTRSIIENNRKIIENLANRSMQPKDSSDLLWIAYYLIKVEDENSKLRAENERLRAINHPNSLRNCT